MVALLVDDTINTRQSRAARYVLPITTAQTANTTPVLRDVRRAIKIFSYTVHGAFFFIFEKEWGVQKRAGDTRPYRRGEKRGRRVKDAAPYRCVERQRVQTGWPARWDGPPEKFSKFFKFRETKRPFISSIYVELI